MNSIPPRYPNHSRSNANITKDTPDSKHYYVVHTPQEKTATEFKFTGEGIQAAEADCTFGAIQQQSNQSYKPTNKHTSSLLAAVKKLKVKRQAGHKYTQSVVVINKDNFKPIS